MKIDFLCQYDFDYKIRSAVLIMMEGMYRVDELSGRAIRFGAISPVANVSFDEKIKLADIVIESKDTQEKTQKTVAKVWKNLLVHEKNKRKAQ